MKTLIQRRNEKYERELARNERRFRHRLREAAFRAELGLPAGMPQASIDVIAKAQAMKHTKQPALPQRGPDTIH